MTEQMNRPNLTEGEIAVKIVMQSDAFATDKEIKDKGTQTIVAISSSLLLKKIYNNLNVFLEKQVVSIILSVLLISIIFESPGKYNNNNDQNKQSNSLNEDLTKRTRRSPFESIEADKAQVFEAIQVIQILGETVFGLVNYKTASELIDDDQKIRDFRKKQYNLGSIEEGSFTDQIIITLTKKIKSGQIEMSNYKFGSFIMLIFELEKFIQDNSLKYLLTDELVMEIYNKTKPDKLIKIFKTVNKEVKKHHNKTITLTAETIKGHLAQKLDIDLIYESKEDELMTQMNSRLEKSIKDLIARLNDDKTLGKMIQKKRVLYVLSLLEAKKIRGDNKQTWPEDWRRIVEIISKIKGVKLADKSQEPIKDVKYDPEAIEIKYKLKLNTQKTMENLAREVVKVLNAELNTSPYHLSDEHRGRTKVTAPESG